MGVLVHSEPTQIANDLQDVLIDSVDMKQIVLHLADNLSKDGQHTAKDSQVIHQPKSMHNAARLLK
jgi:hypothetical protein